MYFQLGMECGLELNLYSSTGLYLGNVQGRRKYSTCQLLS